MGKTKMHNEMNQEIKNIFTDDYPYWLKTRCKYQPAIPMGILASLQPRKTAIDRDYLNSPICSFLNAAISLNKSLSPDEFKMFAIVYYKQSATVYYRAIDSDWYNVKMAADKFELTNSAVYNKAHQFAIRCYNQAISTLNTNDKLQTMLITPNFEFVKQNA
jgi:hypothetical protein